MAEQLNLFSEEEVIIKKGMRSGGSKNPIVFRDYESYLEKFADLPKTTDDTFTPRDVYEAVVDYVSSVYDMTDKVILRPFFPGGDYERAEYPENGVVIDNPPFSIFSKITRFYAVNKIPFFLFGPGMSIACYCDVCTAVIISSQIIFENSALIRCNFASNLFGDKIIMTAPELDQKIAACKSQRQKVKFPAYSYPEEVLSVSTMQTICQGGLSYSLNRNEAIVINDLDLHPKKNGLYGAHLLISTSKAKEKEKLKAEAKNIIPIELSERERRLVEKLEQ